jgi:hypothetical protein
MPLKRGRADARSGAPVPKKGGKSAEDLRSSEPPLEVPEWVELVRATVENKAPLLRSLLVRGINAVLQFTALSEKAIANATEAPTDLAVLLRALSSPELLEDLKKADPLAPGVSRQMIDRKRQHGKLLAVSTGRHGYRYPAWQFEPSGVLPGLEDALSVLAPFDSWMQVAFFVSPNERLQGKTPIEALKAGDLEAVLEAGAVYGEHGA